MALIEIASLLGVALQGRRYSLGQRDAGRHHTLHRRPRPATPEHQQISFAPRDFTNAKNKSIIVDIKSCLDSSAKEFKRSVYNYGYSISAAYYCDFLKRENYIFAAVEKEAPFQVSLYSLNDDMIQYGREQYRTGLDLLKWSQDNSYWCDYNEFEVLKECYQLGNLDNFFDLKDNSELITIL